MYRNRSYIRSQARQEALSLRGELFADDLTEDQLFALFLRAEWGFSWQAIARELGGMENPAVEAVNQWRDARWMRKALILWRDYQREEATLRAARQLLKLVDQGDAPTVRKLLKDAGSFKD